MYCGKCGKHIKDSEQFCGCCGSAVLTKNSVAAAPGSVGIGIRQNLVLFLMPYIYLTLSLLHTSVIIPIIARYGAVILNRYSLIMSFVLHSVFGIVVGGLTVFTINNAKGVKWLFLIPVFLVQSVSLLTRISTLVRVESIRIFTSVGFTKVFLAIIIAGVFKKRLKDRQITKKMLLIPVVVTYVVCYFGLGLTDNLMRAILLFDFSFPIGLSTIFGWMLGAACSLFAVLMARTKQSV